MRLFLLGQHIPNSEPDSSKESGIGRPRKESINMGVLEHTHRNLAKLISDR